MLIQIPVTMVFDCENLSERRTSPRTFTLRYDTEDGDKPGEYCLQYPPPANAHWFPDTAGILLGFMSASVDKAIAARAERDPESYAAVATS